MWVHSMHKKDLLQGCQTYGMRPKSGPPERPILAREMNLCKNDTEDIKCDLSMNVTAMFIYFH